MTDPPPTRLARRLGVSDAVFVGLGAMLGTGLFVVPGAAAALAGTWLLAAVVLAGLVAYANATSSARLAARYPTSGGTYAYGRRRLGEGWGAAAGYAFVIGKCASAAAAALAAATYALPDTGEIGRRALAALAVVALTGLNLRGVARTAAVTRWLVVGLLGALALIVAVLLAGTPEGVRVDAPADVGARDLLGAAGLMFFAFAGYARITVLGEEVRDPARTIPRAIPIALGIALLTYLLVCATLLDVLGAGGLAASSVPVADAAAAAAPALEPVVRVAAVVAALAVLLSLVAGIARTVFAMAADGELPRRLAGVSARSVPHVAEAAVGAVVLVVTLVGGLRGAVGVSACTVLVYYAVTNAAAFTLGGSRVHRAGAAAGVVGCVVLSLSLPTRSVAVGLGVLAVLLAGRAVVGPGRLRES